jgi:alpha-beta hydrolase superfamily lysophospholipase
MKTESSYFDGPSGRLFERHWTPEGDGPRAHLVIVHGYAEHSGRYEHVGAYFAGRGYAVHAYDLRGHGQSDGERVFVRSMAEHLDDLDAVLARVREQAGDRPIFLLGHSMGGGIVALSLVTRRPQLRGVLLSGAVLPVGSGFGQHMVSRLLAAVGRVAPRLRLRKLAADSVSKDPAVVALYDADPLNFRGKIPAGTVAAMIRAGRAIDKRAGTIRDPLLIMHGAADSLTSSEGSERLYGRVASTDKKLKLYQGLYHEILNEPEQRQVMDDMVAWMDARSTGASVVPAASSDAAS